MDGLSWLAWTRFASLPCLPSSPLNSRKRAKVYHAPGDPTPEIGNQSTNWILLLLRSDDSDIELRLLRNKCGPSHGHCVTATAIILASLAYSLLQDFS